MTQRISYQVEPTVRPGLILQISLIDLIRFSGAAIVSLSFLARRYPLMIVNFRLELSRLHAEWLVEQKSEATREPSLISRIYRSLNVGPTQNGDEGSREESVPRF